MSLRYRRDFYPTWRDVSPRQSVVLAGVLGGAIFSHSPSVEVQTTRQFLDVSSTMIEEGLFVVDVPDGLEQGVADRVTNLTHSLRQYSKSDAWEEPHVSMEGSDVATLEWWQGEKKLTLFVSESQVEFLKVWGPNMVSEMEEGAVGAGRSLMDLWDWLT